MKNELGAGRFEGGGDGIGFTDVELVEGDAARQRLFKVFDPPGREEAQSSGVATWAW